MEGLVGIDVLLPLVVVKSYPFHLRSLRIVNCPNYDSKHLLESQPSIKKLHLQWATSYNGDNQSRTGVDFSNILPGLEEVRGSLEFITNVMLDHPSVQRVATILTDAAAAHSLIDAMRNRAVKITSLAVDLGWLRPNELIQHLSSVAASGSIERLEIRQVRQEYSVRGFLKTSVRV